MSITKKTPVILPSETWAREFDAKLLLACCLAEKDFPVYVGCKNTIHYNIAKFPTGLYLAKDFRVSSDLIFSIMKRLGHTIMAWDEEATLPFDRDEYHTVRISEAAFSKVSAFFAWGPVNQETLQTAPYPLHGPVLLTGNPRRDLAKPEIRGYFDAEVEALRQRYGRFLLINTHFGKVNHYVDQEVVLPGDVDWGLRGKPTSAKYDKRGVLKYELYKHFLELIPKLAETFGDLKIVIRPHPSESHASYKDAAEGHDNVEIVCEGHVYPWLLASEVMIHSGCTTGMEGYLLEKPVVSYQPITTEQSKVSLPNQLSHNVYDYDELTETVQGYLSGKLKASRSDELDALVTPYIISDERVLASDEIANAIEGFASKGQLNGRAKITDKAIGWASAKLRAAKKRRDWANPNHKSNLDYDRHRFPKLEVANVDQGIRRFHQLLGRFDGIGASKIDENVFLVSKG